MSVIMTTVETMPCAVCHKRSTLEIPEENYYLWRDRGVLIQNAFPDLSPGERELLMTGTHEECWDSDFGCD